MSVRSKRACGPEFFRSAARLGKAVGWTQINQPNRNELARRCAGAAQWLPIDD